MKVTREEWRALNAALSVAETALENFPKAFATQADDIRAAREAHQQAEVKDRKAYLPSRHPLRNN